MRPQERFAMVAFLCGAVVAVPLLIWHASMMLAAYSLWPYAGAVALFLCGYVTVRSERSSD